MKSDQSRLEIGMLLYPGLTLLDLIGPQTVFSWFANIHLVWKTTDLIETDTGIGIRPSDTFETCPRDLDILFVPGGCPVAAGLFEFDDIEGPVRDKILQMEGEWRELLLAFVQEAVERGQLRRDLDRDQFVWELCGIYLSHHAAHRFLRSKDADRRARTAFNALLERAAPVAAKRVR